MRLSAALSLSLLLKVVLNTSLLGLALGTELVKVSLTFSITSQAGDGAANSSLDTVANTRAKIIQLTLSLLVLTLEVLLSTRLLQ